MMRKTAGSKNGNACAHAGTKNACRGAKNPRSERDNLCEHMLQLKHNNYGIAQQPQQAEAARDGDLSVEWP